MRATETFRNRDSLVNAILNAVSQVECVPADELPTLYDVVDPDSLVDLATPALNSTRSTVSITFEIGDCLVTVSSEGRVVAQGGVERAGREQLRTDKKAISDGGESPLEPVPDHVEIDDHRGVPAEYCAFSTVVVVADSIDDQNLEGVN